MSLIEIRKRSLTIETIYHEGGPAPATPLRLAAACAVIRNPYAGRYEPDLMPFMAELRHAVGLRTARESLADLCDQGSFIEYGALAVAAQSQRRSADDLMRNTPADGMVTGIGCVNGQRVVVMAYDFTVLAGTQGMRNHQKTDRMLGIALQHRLPVVLFAEGGGGRPGDVDMPIVAGLHVASFASFARLNGKVPVVGIAAGRHIGQCLGEVGAHLVGVAADLDQARHPGIAHPRGKGGDALALGAPPEFGDIRTGTRSFEQPLVVANQGDASVTVTQITATAGLVVGGDEGAVAESNRVDPSAGGAARSPSNSVGRSQNQAALADCDPEPAAVRGAVANADKPAGGKTRGARRPG